MPIDMFYFTVNRKDKEDEIKEHLKLEREVLKQVSEFEKLIVF